MYIVHCIRCSINYMKGTGIELCYMAVLPHDSSYFWRVVNAKVKVKIGNKVEPRSFKSSFIQNPTVSHLITQLALVLTRCPWPSPTKRWWPGATLLPLLEEPPTSLSQPVKTAHRWFKGFELLNSSVLDKMPSTLTSQANVHYRSTGRPRAGVNITSCRTPSKVIYTFRVFLLSLQIIKESLKDDFLNFSWRRKKADIWNPKLAATTVQAGPDSLPIAQSVGQCELFRVCLFVWQ